MPELSHSPDGSKDQPQNADRKESPAAQAPDDTSAQERADNPRTLDGPRGPASTGLANYWKGDVAIRQPAEPAAPEAVQRKPSGLGDPFDNHELKKPEFTPGAFEDVILTKAEGRLTSPPDGREPFENVREGTYPNKGSVYLYAGNEEGLHNFGDKEIRNRG